MILFVSGRCDIPAFYMQWFMKRLTAGFVDVRNPFNEHQISRILLNEDMVDCLFFCTKNPIPMLPYLDEIKLPYFVHVTVTPYHSDMECRVPDKRTILQAVKDMAVKLGKDRVMLRYDPIILNDRYTVAYHQRAFHHLLQELSGYIDTCIISFVDLYKNTRANQSLIRMKPITPDDIHALCSSFQKDAALYGFQIQTCAEGKIDLKRYQIYDRPCVELEAVQKLCGKDLQYRKIAGVRKQLCGCLPTVDIGDYNACAHECLYCYANYNARSIRERMAAHDPNASVLLGHIEAQDSITIRKDYKKKSAV